MAQEIENSSQEQEEIKLLVPSKRKKKDKDSGIDPNAWMVTFSDLITLMMTFFVLLYSFNEPNPKKVQSLSAAQPGLFDVAKSEAMQAIHVIQANSTIRENLDILLAENDVRNAEVSERKEGLVITIPADIMFQRNSANLSAKAKKKIRKIADYLKKTGHDIRIEGHTSSDFVPTRRYRDRWSLSLGRAKSTLNEILKVGVDPSRLSLIGRGDSVPKTAKGRKINRRVDIVLLNPGFHP